MCFLRISILFFRCVVFAFAISVACTLETQNARTHTHTNICDNTMLMTRTDAFVIFLAIRITLHLDFIQLFWNQLNFIDFQCLQPSGTMASKRLCQTCQPSLAVAKLSRISIFGNLFGIADDLQLKKIRLVFFLFAFKPIEWGYRSTLEKPKTNYILQKSNIVLSSLCGRYHPPMYSTNISLYNLPILVSKSFFGE